MSIDRKQLIWLMKMALHYHPVDHHARLRADIERLEAEERADTTPPLRQGELAFGVDRILGKYAAEEIVVKQEPIDEGSADDKMKDALTEKIVWFAQTAQRLMMENIVVPQAAAVVESQEPNTEMDAIFAAIAASTAVTIASVIREETPE